MVTYQSSKEMNDLDNKYWFLSPYCNESLYSRTPIEGLGLFSIN